MGALPRLGLKSPAQSGSIDPQAYADYLRTTPGRLREDLAWANLHGFLPSVPGAAALDVGGGTGGMSVRLAKFGFHVTVLDVSEAMLAAVERAARAANLCQRITLVHGDACQLRRLFSPASFSVIVCHNVIEFVECPAEVLQAVSSLLMRADNAVASVIVRNRAGEILSAALKDGDLAAANRNLTAPNVRTKLGNQAVAVFTPPELRDMAASAGLNPLAEFGIRVFSDYLPEQPAEESCNYSALLALERKLGSQPSFAAIARYSQIIARPCSPDNQAPRQPR